MRVRKSRLASETYNMVHPLNFSRRSNCQSTPAAAFCQCHYLKAVSFPSTLRRIGEGAFVGVEAPLVALPDGLEAMGVQALFSDSQNVRLPASLLELPEGAFRENNSLLSR